MLPSQTDLIGNHPSPPNPFTKWLTCTDVPRTSTKCHRSLVGAISNSDTELIEWLARRLIYHHYDDERIEKLKKNYRELGFPEYSEQHRKLPRADKTMKGNATEILLIEYIENCQNKPLIKAFKLRYNPNVDQAIKGDDTLMVDLSKGTGGKEQVKLFLGEAKFRQTPTKTIVDTIAQSLCLTKKPLSYSFLVDELERTDATKPLAKILDKFIVDEIKGKGNLIYAGFLLSNKDTFDVVETHLTSNNPSLVFISAGIDAPEDLIVKAFARAEELIANPDQI